ncbi:hypothetical protein Cri9333_4794 (plasmid) [Crinalium epipsammum PCC 9333]|uniref:Uncharacterized protein n=1 Tax=Crinalium epipsammum PCC 9333 TaxID=1173022 RepID=K9W704_9CYAN|nr:hypothetical protein Cri9333_4794 [Crinalium epipsammum PCC 9333]
MKAVEILLYMLYIQTYILICDQHLIVAKINPLKNLTQFPNRGNPTLMALIDQLVI